MTVSSVYTPPQYAGDGTTTAFAFPFNFFQPSDLDVLLYSGTPLVPVSPAPVLNGLMTYDYTVTGAQDPNTGEYLGGGTVIFNTAPPKGYVVSLVRAVSATQGTSLTNNAPFPAKTIEGSLDRAMMLVQEALAQLALAIVAPTSDPAGLGYTLPAATARAGQFLGFDDIGDVMVGTLSGAGVPISTAMQPVVAAGTLAEALTQMGFSSAVQSVIGEASLAAFLAGIGADGPIINVLDYMTAAQISDVLAGTLTLDCTASINAALAAAGNGALVYAPAGTYRISGAITVGLANTVLAGAGLGATTFVNYSGTGNWFSISQSYSGVRDCTLTSAYVAGGAAPTAGFAVVLSGGALYQTIDNVLILYAWNGIRVGGTSEVRLNRIYMRYLFGTVGIQTYATSAGNYRCVVNDLSCYNPYPTSITLFPVTWSAGLNVTAGQVASINNAVYQCTTSGTTATSGSGPNNITSFSAPIADGTAEWKFVCNDLTWVEMNSFSYSLVINEANLIYGVYGLAMRDALGSGTSWPNWCFCWDLECDHNFSAGVTLEGGAGFWAGGSWIGSQLTGSGIQAVGSFLGEAFLGAGSRLVGAAQHGALIEVGFGYQFRDLYVAANSISSDGTYSGITFGAGVTDFSVNNVTSGPNADVNAPGQQYGIYVSPGVSDYYDISHNNVRDNHTGGVYDGGTGAHKVVGWNLGSDNNLGVVDYLSSGTIMQNGAATSGSGGTIAVTWPVGFPTACKTVLASPVGGGTDDVSILTGTFSPTGTTFTCLNGTTPTSGIGFTWIALGY